MMAIGAIVLLILLFVVLALAALGLFGLAGSGRIERTEIILIGGLGLMALLALACVVAGAMFFSIRSAPAPAPAMPYPTAPPLPLATGTPTQVILVPPEPTIHVGEAISITIYVMNVSNLYGVEARIVYDAEGLEARGLTPGTCTGGAMAQARSSAGEGVVSYIAARSATDPPFSGDCDVATFTIVSLKPGDYPLTFETITLTDAREERLPADVTGGIVTVTP